MPRTWSGTPPPRNTEAPQKATPGFTPSKSTYVREFSAVR
jgi:hypothetical protein